MKPERKIILDAANIITVGGWVKGRTEHGKKRCMSAAFMDAAGHPDTPRGAARRAWNFVGRVTCDATVGFNDFHCKTKHDAIAALLLAADLAA